MSIESSGGADPRFVNDRYIGEQALDRLDTDDEAALSEMEERHDAARALSVQDFAQLPPEEQLRLSRQAAQEAPDFVTRSFHITRGRRAAIEILRREEQGSSSEQTS